jgi:sigma-E factor negative regulatory protein RseA
MTQPKDSNPHELVSALADGELSGEAFVQALDWLEVSDEARANWNAYHLVGDVLRSGELAALGANDSGFVARLRSRLKGELVYRPPEIAVDLMAGDAQTRSKTGSIENTKESANDTSLRWRVAACFAAAATVAVVAWQLVAGLTSPVAAPQLARSEARPEQEQPQVMIRDPQLDKLLAAHQQSGGISALQKPAGFLRDATFDGSDR